MGKEKVEILRNEVLKSLSVLGKLDIFISEFKEKTLQQKRGTAEAMILSQSISQYYTCAETVFFRISVFFENNLSKEHWHKELLNRMTLRIDGIREAVITDELRQALDELLKFRYFTRYYFDLNYDWDKLDFIMKKYAFVREKLPLQLDQFLVFVERLGEEIGT